MIGKKIIFSILVFAFSTGLFGQSTPDELGRMVFASFQAKDISKLDSLIPTASQIIIISNEKGLNTNNIQLRNNFDEVYQHHLQKFKEKCRQFINDTVFFKIDWSSCSFDKSISSEKEINVTVDSVQNSQKVKVHSLDIYFSDKQHSFIISFKDIYNYRSVWKIGDNVKFRRKEEE